MACFYFFPWILKPHLLNKANNWQTRSGFGKFHRYALNSQLHFRLQPVGGEAAAPKMPSCDVCCPPLLACVLTSLAHASKMQLIGNMACAAEEGYSACPSGLMLCLCGLVMSCPCMFLGALRKLSWIVKSCFVISLRCRASKVRGQGGPS